MLITHGTFSSVAFWKIQAIPSRKLACGPTSMARTTAIKACDAKPGGHEEAAGISRIGHSAAGGDAAHVSAMSNAVVILRRRRRVGACWRERRALQLHPIIETSIGSCQGCTGRVRCCRRRPCDQRRRSLIPEGDQAPGEIGMTAVDAAVDHSNQHALAVLCSVGQARKQFVEVNRGADKVAGRSRLVEPRSDA